MMFDLGNSFAVHYASCYFVIHLNADLAPNQINQKMM